MDKNIEYRLDINIFKTLIGKTFKEYKCNPFLCTNTVYQIVGLYINDEVYKIFNYADALDYFGIYEDIATWSFSKCVDKDIVSSVMEREMIDTPVNEKIMSITLVNENQRITIDNINYNVWLTRAIIFHLETKDICFEKDISAFSEEIGIKRGYELLKEYPKYNDFFLEDWNDGLKHEINSEFISLE